MEQQLLFQKDHKGKHWVTNPKIYSEQFSKFLKKHNFNGLLVDIGCGEGRDVSVFHKKGYDVLGININEREINLARSNYPDCNFELQNAENLKFKDNRVSAFFMINVIHYTKEEKVIEEIYRTLKKNGYLFIHFNLLIMDNEGNIDYEQKEEDILSLIPDFEIVEKRIIRRTDIDPIRHTHKIMELILQKK